MILESSGYLALLALAGWIIALHILRTRRVRREVAYLSLWERLPDDSRARAARVRLRWDIHVVLQLLVLAALVLALSAPAFLTRRPSVASLAVVLDGSASTRARTEGGSDISDLVRSEALAVLDRHATSPVAVLELSASPRVLASLSSDRSAARRAIADWAPTWFGDGSEEDLRGLLASQGGAFERTVYLTDRGPLFSLPGLTVTVFSPGENIALTAFSVREDLRGTGSIAFLRVRNDTSSYREVGVRVSDGAADASLPALLAPGEEHAYVLPFPMSLGPVFRATIEGDDAFPADDARVFSLARPTEWRVRVVGSPDRYLRAALTSIRAVRLLEDSDSGPADLTVACGVTLSEDAPGNILLVHSSLQGVVELGDVEERGEGRVLAAHRDDPLLLDVAPESFVVPRCPSVRELSAGVAALSVEGAPVLWRAELPDRRVVLLAPDPVQTNLPLTVDFPVIVRNAVRWLALASSSAPPSAATAGAAIPFSAYGTPERLRDPVGREMKVEPTSYGFIATTPGVYELVTASGAYPIAVNVSENESPRALSHMLETSRGAESPATHEAALGSAWRIAAALGFLLLVAECAAYHRPSWRKGRA